MAQADNVLFLPYNLARSSGVAVTASSEALPAVNVLDSSSGFVWRAEAADGDPWIIVNLGFAQTFRYLAFAGTNLTQGSGIYQFEAADNIGMAGPIFTGDVENYGVAGLGDVGAHVRVIDCGVDVTAQYVRLKLSDAALAVGPTVGAIFVGNGFQMERNMGFPQHGLEDTSKHFKMSKNRRVRAGERSLVTRFPLPGMTPDDLTLYDELMWINGQSEPLIAVLYPTAAEPKRTKFMIYGVITEADQPVSASLHRYASRLVISEQ